jgi:chlorophyllide a oxygenase
LQARVSELRLSHSSARVAELERALRSAPPSGTSSADADAPSVAPPAPDALILEHWFPVAHASALGAGTLLPFDLFGGAWLLFRDAAGRGACLADACAHRACPLSLGRNVGGRVQCAYHGWEFAAGGACEAMPSTPLLPGVSVRALPVLEQDGLLWVWPGRGTPAAALPRLAPPRGFTLVAATSIDVERDADALVAALLDATGGAPAALALPPVPESSASGASRAVTPAQPPYLEAADGAGLVAAAARALRVSGGGGAFLAAASPAAVAFEPPGAVVTTLQLGGDADAGDGDDAQARRVHVLFACVPALPGRTRLLYRLAVNFASPALATAPGAATLWQALADDLLREQLAALDAATTAASAVGSAAPAQGRSAAADAFATWRRAMLQ